MFDVNINKKIIAVIVITISLISSLVPAICPGSYAMPELDVEETSGQLVWFDYEDGIVRDGSVGDEPGLIGDEYDSSYPMAYGDNYNQGNMTPSPDMAQDGYATADGRVAGVTDTDNSMESFWGVVLALVVGAAAILIAVFAIPKSSTDGSSRGR